MTLELPSTADDPTGQVAKATQKEGTLNRVRLREEVAGKRPNIRSNSVHARSDPAPF